MIDPGGILGLQGTLDTMPMAELIHWMAPKNFTGLLTVKQADLSKTITIENGQVVNAASTDPREYFGQFLINFGLISEDQLQRAFETQVETTVLIGKVLVMTGLVSEDQVQRVLELKIRETFLDIFLWDDGLFEFQDGVIPEESSTIPVSVDLPSLYQEGVSRQGLFQLIRKVIPNNDCHFTCLDRAIPKKLDPRSADAVMLQMVRQGLSAADIILRFHSMDFLILRALHDLVQRGWIAVSTDHEATCEAVIPEPDVVIEPAPKKARPGTYVAMAQEALRKNDFDQALTVLRHGLSQHPYDPDLRAALEQAERSLTETLRTELTDKRIPYLILASAATQSGNFTPAQRYILSRIDGQRTLRSIIMVSPLKEIEALKIFHTLKKAGVIGLR